MAKKEVLIVIDMQYDFITGALANDDAFKIIDPMADYIEKFEGDVIATLDTHDENYMNTQEGRRLPVPHCIEGTKGHEIVPAIEEKLYAKKFTTLLKKPTFGSTALANLVRKNGYTDAILVGICTDICVISNAMLIKAFAPEVNVTVLKDLCAGVTPESHEIALKAMEACQIDIK